MLLPILKSFDWTLPELPTQEEMKKTGKLIEETKESESYVTKTLHYESNDGSTKIMRMITEPKKKSKELTLQQNLDNAIANQDFEEAIKLRDEIKKGT